MNPCYYHSDLPALGVCSRCGRRLCGSCSKPYSGLTLCPVCFHSLPVAQVAPTPTLAVATQSSVVRPPGWYGPYSRLPFLARFSWVPAALVGVAAILIVLNGAALLVPAFFGAWSSFLPWVSVLGSFGVILGIVLGLMLMGAVVMMFLGFRIFSALVILPTSVVSLFIGGGFIIGALLGVLGGILLLL